MVQEDEIKARLIQVIGPADEDSRDYEYSDRLSRSRGVKMTPEKRIAEISEKCGLSEEVVRLVLKAEAESVAESLLKGEHAVLLGRCIMKPRISNGKVKISCQASMSMERTLEEQKERLDLEEKKPTIPYVAIEQLKGLV